MKSNSWRMNLPTAAAIWAAVVIFAAFYGIRLSLSGPCFAVALGVAAVLFAFDLFLASPPVMDACRRILGDRGSVLAPLVPLFAMLIYAIAVSGGWRSALIGTAYVVLPSLLVASSAGKPPGTFGDYVAAAIIWLPVEFRWMYQLFPFPSQLTHTLTILLALSTGIAAFVLLRRTDGIGYAAALNKGDLWIALLHFAIFAVIAIILGMRIGFLAYDPSIVDSRNSLIHGMARRIFISRRAAESIFTELQKSVGGLGVGFGDLRPVTHLPCAISELEICVAGYNRGFFLRAHLDENWVNLSGDHRACSGRHPLAHSFPLVPRR
jgi:hypothetical protein